MITDRDPDHIYSLFVAIVFHVAIFLLHLHNRPISLSSPWSNQTQELADEIYQLVDETAEETSRLTSSTSTLVEKLQQLALAPPPPPFLANFTGQRIPRRSICRCAAEAVSTVCRHQGYTRCRESAS